MERPQWYQAGNEAPGTNVARGAQRILWSSVGTKLGRLDSTIATGEKEAWRTLPHDRITKVEGLIGQGVVWQGHAAGRRFYFEARFLRGRRRRRGEWPQGNRLWN